MKGTTNATQQTLFGEILNLRLVTNQSSHEDLIGATVKINSQMYTWYGQDITVEIPAMMTYTIEAFEVEGYRTPEIQTINSQVGNVNNVTLSYDCELVTINVSDSDGNTLDFGNVTVNGIVGNKVPYGEVYTIVANTIDGYRTPASQTYTANQPQRTVDIVYISKFGIFIEDIDGNLYTEAQWDGSKTANGIAVLTDNCRFVIALHNTDTSSYIWATNGAIIDGITTSTLKNVAQADYDGDTQTTTIINYMDGWVLGAPAAEHCRAYTFPNGKKGYLGAAGEWQAALDNKAAITSALSKCGGTKMSSFYWTSTQYNTGYAWRCYWSSDYIHAQDKQGKLSVRAFTSLKSDGEESGGGLINFKYT